MRHIATRAFPIPPSIDILYCEQEVVADDYTAVDSVLKADVKRTELLEECKKLEAAQESGDTTVQDRLKEVIFSYYENTIYSPVNLDHLRVVSGKISFKGFIS